MIILPFDSLQIFNETIFNIIFAIFLGAFKLSSKLKTIWLFIYFLDVIGQTVKVE